MVADVQKLGDPVRGEAVYRRKDMSCIKCHAIGGGVARSVPTWPALVPARRSITSSNRSCCPTEPVKEGYHAVKVTLLNGKVFCGIKKRDSKTEIALARCGRQGNRGLGQGY